MTNKLFIKTYSRNGGDKMAEWIEHCLKSMSQKQFLTICVQISEFQEKKNNKGRL